MEIKLINSCEFYITQQDKVLYQSHLLWAYKGILIKSVTCPEFVLGKNILFLRGNEKRRDCDRVKVPQEKMKQVFTALSLCCIEYGVTLTIKL